MELPSASWTHELNKSASDWLSFSSGTLFDGFGLGLEGFLPRSWVESDILFLVFLTLRSAPYRIGFLTLSIVDILGWLSLCCGACPVL